MPRLIEHDSKEVKVPSNGDGSSVRRFLGLKWKVLLLSSLILLAIVIIFTVISYRILINNFEINLL